jgi:4'-phosphopantetheinyl transferase
MEQQLPRLSPVERTRASAFSDIVVRDEWLATHIALRLLIERAAGPQWRGTPFARSDRGKPRLQGAPLSFSLSHAPGLALIGISRQGSIGVDIERMRKVRIGAARRQRIVQAAAALAPAPLPANGEAQFLQAWVRLEAYAKAEGCGIGRLLTRLGILGAGHAASGSLPGASQPDLQALSALDLQVGDNIYAAAVFAGAPSTTDVAWLPTSGDGLEKLIS